MMDEWVVPDPAELAVAKAVTPEVLEDDDLSVTIEGDGYGRHSAVIRFSDDGPVIVVGRMNSHDPGLHIQVYGDAKPHVVTEDLHSGRVDLGARQLYLRLDY